MSDFLRDVTWTIAREGGARVTNYSYDPGGLTKYGIAKKFHPSVDVANLTLEGAEAIYHSEYWLPSGAQGYAEPLALNVFDAAVNLGVPRAKALLDAPRVILPPDSETYLWARVAFYVNLVVQHPEKAPSLAGWIKRCLLARTESASRAAS